MTCDIVMMIFLISYLIVDGLQLGPLQYPDQEYVAEPSDPDQRVISAKVTGLKPLQMYRFYVWAYTNAGQGSEYFIDDSTVAAGCMLINKFPAYFLLATSRENCLLLTLNDINKSICQFLFINFELSPL